MAVEVAVIAARVSVPRRTLAVPRKVGVLVMNARAASSTGCGGRRAVAGASSQARYELLCEQHRLRLTPWRSSTGCGP